jgi:hypothetical protein
MYLILTALITPYWYLIQPRNFVVVRVHIHVMQYGLPYPHPGRRRLGMAMVGRQNQDGHLSSEPEGLLVDVS